MRKGFTLSELLLALIIIGVVATLTVPILMNNVHNKMFANQVKNMSATIVQLAQEQLIEHRTKDLDNTDFGNPEKLLSNDHFSIAKSCTSDESLTKCWKTNAEGKEKVTYKKLNKTTDSIEAGQTIILKNGVLMKYFLTPNNDKTVGMFVFDVNGNDKPNITGRDLFAFYITRKGYLADSGINSPEETSLADKISKCKTTSDATWCYGALADNGWKMDY